MTRTRVESPALRGWEEADAALRRVGEIEIEAERIEGRAQEAINRIKEKAAGRCALLGKAKEALLLQLQQFTEAHRADLKGKGRKKSKLLVFGQVGFRASERVMKLAEDAEIIARLRNMGLTGCFKVKESPDLTAIKGLPRDVMNNVCCELEKRDDFWCEPDRQKIEEARG